MKELCKVAVFAVAAVATCAIWYWNGYLDGRKERIPCARVQQLLVEV